MQQVSPSVYAETGLPGCNVGAIVTSEGVVLIDSPQRPSDAVRWREAVRSKGPVRYLVNTEHHRDHVTGNFFFDTAVVSHEGPKRAFLASLGPVEQLKETLGAMDPDGVALMEGYRPRPPSITYSERLTLYLGGHTLTLMHLPGHTRTETAVYVPEEKVLLTGDNVVSRTMPFLHQCVPLQWLESLKAIEGLDIDVIVPGHGEIGDKSAVGQMAALIEEIIEAVRRAMASGLSREAVADQVNFLGRFPIDPAMAAMMERVWRMGVLRVYDQLLKQG